MKPKNIKITKNNTNFNISPLSIHLDWFTKRYKNWEPQTFKILDDFINPNKSFIDIGAHIGLVLLYGADKAKKVLGVECDHVAFDSLKKNVNCNNFKDKVVLDYSALSNFSGTVLIGKGKRGAEWGGSGIAITDSSDISAKEIEANFIHINTPSFDECFGSSEYYIKYV
jgi:FkbM family methyltransferase